MRRINPTAALVTLLWLASMGALIERHYVPYETPGAVESPPEWLFEESWMGIYQGTNKVGYASSRMERAGGGYRAVSNSLMRLTVMGAGKEIKTSVEALLDEGFRVNSFSFGLSSDVSIRVEGRMEGKEMLMSIDMNGVKTEKRLRLDEAPYLGPDVTLILKGPEPGMKFRFPVVSPSSLSAGHMEVVVAGKEPVTVMGLRQDAFRLEGDFMGADFTLWIKDTGEVLKQEAMGFTYIKESEEAAKAVGAPSLDLIADLAVPANTHIPEGVSYLKVRLEGVDLKGFELEGGVQSLSEGGTLEIRIPKQIKSVKAAAGMEEYLGGAFLIESDDPSIVSLAREIVGDEKGPIHRARLISEWVHANVKKVPTMTIPSALDVLKTRRGDCNEHTTFYTALARAAGVPTRIAVGLVHNDGFFYYHAWPEIFMDRWIPVDPTLGQFPADATHIRLLTGGIENQLKLGSAIEKLKIHVIDYRL